MEEERVQQMQFVIELKTYRLLDIESEVKWKNVTLLLYMCLGFCILKTKLDLKDIVQGWISLQASTNNNLWPTHQM